MCPTSTFSRKVYRFFFLNKLFSDAYYKCMTTDQSDYCFSQWAFIAAFHKYLKRGNLIQLLDNTLSSLYPMYLDIEKIFDLDKSHVSHQIHPIINTDAVTYVLHKHFALYD